MIQPRYIAALAAFQMFISCYMFYKQRHWAYIPPMLGMAICCLFCVYIDWKRHCNTRDINER